MPRIELRDLLSNPTITPEQQIFITWFYSRFDNGAAILQRIINVVPLFYDGVITTSEFNIGNWADNKLYICLELVLVDATNSGSFANLELGDELANALIHISSGFGVWRIGSTLQIESSNRRFTNLWFGCITTASLNRMRFTGFRVTVI